MIRDEDDFLMTTGELAALAAGFSASRGPLTLLPAEEASLEDKKTAAASLKKFSAGEHENLKKAVLSLADPVCAARLHHAVADETITRSMLAWPHSGESAKNDEIVCVTQVGKNRRLSLRSGWELSALLNRLLAVGPGLREANFGCRLSSLATMTLLGVFDQLQHARLYSMLAHASPVDSVSPAEVFKRLAESELEDFRWVVPFLEKVLPTGTLTVITKPEVTASFDELVRTGLVEAVDQVGSLYQLTGSGQFAADAVFHNLSRVAICLSTLRPDGLTGFECLLFLRGPAGLFLYDISGAEGAVMTLPQTAVNELLENLFACSRNATHLSAGKKDSGVPEPGILPPAPEKLKRD